MTDPTPAAILEVIRGAGRAVAEYQQSAARTAVHRDTKKDRHDIVTEHDRRCEEIAVTALRAAYPDCRIVGEEAGVQAGDGRITFYVDPIDGTSNFVSGMPLFAVSIGATVDGELTAGVVHAPLLGHEFYGATGQGSWVASFDAPGPVRLGARIERGTEDALVLTGFPSARDLRLWGEEGGAVARSFAGRYMAVRNLGSTALELAFTAAGWVDGAYGTGAGSWDLAGGLAILHEAGGGYHHRALRGASGPLPWEHPGYAVTAPGRSIPELEETLDVLDELATRL